MIELKEKKERRKGRKKESKKERKQEKKCSFVTNSFKRSIERAWRTNHEKTKEPWLNEGKSFPAISRKNDETVCCHF